MYSPAAEEDDVEVTEVQGLVLYAKQIGTEDDAEDVRCNRRSLRGKVKID